MLRLQKYLADGGVASRRGAEKLILEGQVTVNGKIIKVLGSQVDPGRDEVRVFGKKVVKEEEKQYIKFYKPRGVVSSCRKFDEPILADYLQGIKARLFPVGRLDKASEGLMLLTNDGELALKLTHPRYGHEKEYYVEVNGPISDGQLEKIMGGMKIETGPTLPAEVKREGKNSFRIILREGKKRQIRKMVAMTGCKVVLLKRLRIGSLQIGGLKPGEWARLSQEEEARLRENC